MHELTLAASLLELIEQHASANGLSKVVRVHLTLGALAAVDEQALTFGFEVARRGTVAETAELCLERVAGRGACETCGVEVALEARGGACPACGTPCWKVLAGDEMRLSAIEGV